ncbi:hypothetical protein RN001_016011 [Aquatica leii]|uniref:Vitellogenin domain-containing protein n=1 Tax=Aquatica leii TaxID=1421715 RepID=A0AAN7NX09_9COLE|nr:hypothetical protein RN001_016011 [Aquatica leii]
MVPKCDFRWILGIFLIVILQTEAQFSPLKDLNICGKPTCKGGTKFKYRPGVQHIYSYTLDVTSLFNGTSKNESTIHIEATVKLGFISECEGVLSVYDITLSDNPNGVNDQNEEDFDNLLHTNNDIFSEEISDHTIRFSFEDGIITEICPDEDERNWVLNFKRGILSLMQNTMKRFDLDYIISEEDVHGKCETSYKVKGTKETSLLIEKTKNLNSCQSGSEFHSFLQSTPYRFQSVNERDNLMLSTSSCKIAVDRNIYNDVNCEEIHVFQPFSNNAAGAITIVKQILSLQSEFEAILEDLLPITKRTNLLYDQVPTPKPTSGELKASRDALRQLCKLNAKDFQAEFSDLFTQFIHTARLLSYVALSSLYGHAGVICTSGKKHMLDALPHLGSSAGVALMKDIILNDGVTDDTMYDWMNSIAFISRPNDAMMEAASQLLAHKGSDSTVVLSVTALTHTFCKQNSDCFSNEPIGQIITLLENQVLENYKNKFNFLAQEKMLVSLKALANVGVITNEFKNILFLMIKDNNLDIAIKLAASDVFRRLSCEENRRIFEDIFRNQTEDTELRIASYLQVMRCPNYIVMRNIRHSLEVEEVNQVGAFVWSHLKNLLKTSVPSRVEIQSLLSDNDLTKKFSSDIRKFSHNFEGSMFFEEYNMGGGYESNVIFSPESYIPRTGNLNLTVDLFGESINILELNGRIEGFEHYLESIFGPHGPLSARNLQENLPKMRWPRSTGNDAQLMSKMDQITKTQDRKHTEPKVSLGLKVFGNHIKHNTFKGKDEVKEAVLSLNPDKYIKRLISGKEINYNKATMFLDSSYVVATGAGFPLVLNAVGTLAVNLKLYGSLKAEDFLKTKALDLVGDVRPSAAVDIVGSMSVDAFYAATAIKLKTNLHTSTAVEGKVKIRGTDLISVSFSIPNEKTSIFGALSELIVVSRGVEDLQKGVDNSEVSRSTCSWPMFEKNIGLKLCANYHYPNVTKIESAPFFILAGPSGFDISLHKTEPSIKSYVFEYKWEKSSTANAVSVTFETPGSLERRLLSANFTFDVLNNDINLIINSPGKVLIAHGKYKNTEEDKYIQMTLNVNDKKHFDASLSLKQFESRNGYTYIPKAYLGVNGERVAEIQGELKWVSKKGVSQGDVDLKFQTKRLISKLFGYISKTDASVGTNLKLDYKFVNTKEQRAILDVSLANRSTRTLMALLGDIRVETTAYPHFNFEGALKFQRASGRTEGKLEINSGAYTQDYQKDDPNRLKVLLEIKHKTTSGGARFETKIMAVKPASYLDVGAEFHYVVAGPNTDMKALIKYAKEKQAVVTVFWSHPRGTFERYEGHLNITIPNYTPMVIKVKVDERRPSNYDVDLNVSWFSGHTVNVRGIYQDKSTLKTSNHHLKVIIRSPSFSYIEADSQFYQDDVEFKIDVKANQNKNEYALYYKHSVFSLLDISTEGKIKYNNQVYSVTSSMNLRDRKQILLELHLDQFRDIHLELWSHNKELHKTAGLEMKWDANRDPNQKLIVTIEFRNPELYNYAGNFVISYPGRAINGVFDFYIKDGHFLTRSHLTWSPTDKIAFSIDTNYKNDVETLFVIKSELITPIEDWKKVSFNSGYHHVGNMYRVNGSTHWHNNQSISIDLFRDYETNDTSIRYELSSALYSTIKDFPSFTVSIKHKYSVGKVDTNLYFMLNPKKVFGVKSVWHIDENKNTKNLTGTVSLVTPFVGYNKGLLVSKIYVTNKKYLRGVADLDLDHRKYTASVEGHYNKFSDNMFVFNVTTTNEKYKKITGQLGFLEGQRYLVALIQYPTGTLGLEIKLVIESLQKFDVKFYAATPIEFLETVLIVGKLKPEEADFRLGWNSLLAGFSGVWHYANITDFEYSYKIYTPIEGFKQNGVVAKLIFKEGLDFEVSVKLAEKRLGATIIGQPKPTILNELGIKTQALYNENFDGKALSSDEDYDNEVEDPINWSGFIEIDSMIYPTIKCSFDIDQKGTLYVLIGTLTLRDGTVDFKNEFDFMDVLNINNKLYLITPYVSYKEVDIFFDVDVVIGYQYKLSADFNYQNRSAEISMGTSVCYFVEEDEDEVYHNVTLHVHTPYVTLPKLDVQSLLERKGSDYTFNTILATNDSDISVNIKAKLQANLWNATLVTYITSPMIIIPQTRIDFIKESSRNENKLQLKFDMKRNKPSKINLLTAWKYESLTNFKGNIQLETPIKSMEKTEIEFLFALVNKRGEGKLRVLLHPINIVANATIKNNELQSWITSEFNKERRMVILKCELNDVSPKNKVIQGKMTISDKEYAVSGSVNLFEDDWPSDVLIEIKPQQGMPFRMQYQAKQWSINDIVVAVKLSQHLAFINLEATLKSKLKGHWDIHLETNTSNTRYAVFMVDSKVAYTEDVKSLSLNARTPFEHLENPNVEVEYRILGITRKAHLKYQVNDANSSIEGEWCWILMENMQMKLINNYETLNYTERSILELHYINPNRSLTDLQIGGYGNLNERWKASANVNLSMLSIHNLNLKANFKLPNLKEHNVIGRFISNDKWNDINYLLNYTSPSLSRNYGSSGKINYSNQNHLNGIVDVQWNQNHVQNYLDLKQKYKNIDVQYKLRTPNFHSEDTLVTDLSYNYALNHDVMCHIYYPASRAVVKAKIDFKEFANMNGTVDLITPFKKFEYVNSEFITQTSGIVYNRYIKASWPNNTAFIDSKCKTVLGTSALERDTTGVLLVEIPLTTRHVGKVDYKYTEKPNKCIGLATVDYNSNKILEAKYDRQSESRAGFEKDTVRVEAENSYTPIGVTYIHGYQYSLPVADYNTPTIDSKHIEVFHLHNRTGFNVTGEMVLQTTLTGKEMFLTAIHSNRTVKFWSDYDVVGRQFKQHSKIELAPTVWVSYDLSVINKTEDESSDSQQIELNLSYPGRNFTSSGSYNITDNEVMSEFFMVWDEQKRTIEAVLDWKQDPSPHYNRQQVELQIKHPSLEKNVSLLGEYETAGNKLLDLRLTVDYSTNPKQKLELSCLVEDNSNSVATNYTYKISGSHPATKLYLDSHGDIFWKSKWYSTKHLLNYKRTYLPLQSREAFGKIDIVNKEIEFKKKSLRELSYLWAKYKPQFPLYIANLSAIHGNDINATGEFYLNFKKKLIQLELNVTEDGRRSAHMYGEIPDARNAVFDIWRDYDDARVSDISYYLRLNHSRLIVSSLKWRPEIRSDVMNSIRATSVGLYNEIVDNVDYWKQYIYSETADAVSDVWQDAKPEIEQFLNDLEDLKVIEEDISELHKYLQDAYMANEFYIRDIIDYLVVFVDELSIRSHIESLPKIFNEIWEIMGDSGEEIHKRLVWAIEKIKSYYKHTLEFINGLIQGNALDYLSEAFSKLLENYDSFIKDLHVSLIRYLEQLWKQTYTMLLNNWYKMLATLEPTLIKLLHYLETVAWNASKEFVDFLYIRRNEIIESPYFGKFASVSHDIDKFYKDIKANSTFSTVYKYTQVVWKFLTEKYLKLIPFSNELSEIVTEINNELKELRSLPYMEYLNEKCDELYENTLWVVRYFDIGNKIEKFVSLVYYKLTDLGQTALETENRYRTAKTKFIFDPNDGIIYLEQKLPVSWHAFNETPKLQEIPEYKAINDLQNYFITSKTNFWNLYYDYKPYTDPSDWFPPFKAQAMLAGVNYYVTFDRTHYNFHGGCTYLLARDFIDRNFSIAMSYDVTRRNNNELMLIVKNTVVKININDDVVKIGEATISRLPLEVGDLYLYQEFGVVTVDSASGFVLQCNMKFDVCILELSGWYFGKTAGLWGTMNNEPSDDLLTSSGKKVKRNDIDSFAQSWVLDKTCSPLTRQTIQKHNSPEEVKALCGVFFQSTVSPFVACFPRVSNIPFLDMCLNSSSESEACTSAVAYMNLCAVENTPLRIPEACVKCNLLNGTTVPEGEFIRFEGDAVPRSTDVVFIVEAKECNKDLKSKRNTDILVDLMHKEFSELNVTNNRYSVVTFGGNGVFDLPRSIVINGNNFADYRSIKSYFRNIPVGHGNTDIFAAIVFATKLVFLPGVSKTFILLPCSDCQESSMKLDYAILHQLLIENDITLHILMNEEFRFQKSRVNKIFFGMDRIYAFTKNDVRELKGDRDLLGQVRKPKSTLGVCMSFARDTNGSIFTAKKLESDKKNAIKRFATVFAKRVAHSALPKRCQICECTAPNTGLSYMECFPCHYPVFAAIDSDFNEDETLAVMQPAEEEEFDYSDE